MCLPSSFHALIICRFTDTVRLQIIDNTELKLRQNCPTILQRQYLSLRACYGTDLFIRSLIYYAGFSNRGLQLIRSRRGAIIKTLRRVRLG